MIQIPEIALQFEWLQPPRRPKTKLKTTQFKHPADQFRFRYFQSLQEIQKYFQTNSPQQWKFSQQMYKIKRNTDDQSGNIKLTFQCRLCDAHITAKYSAQSQKIQMYSFHNKHRHYINHKAKKSQEILAQEFIKERPPTESYSETIKRMMEKFELNRQRARYIYCKYAGRATETITEVTDRIKKQTNGNTMVEIWYDNQDKSKETMALLVTQTMAKNYQIYSDCLCFDITYRLVRKYHFYSIKKCRHQIQEWGVGFFIGQDSNLRLVLFGVALIQNQSSENMHALFTSYFRMMKGRMPQTIVTDQQASIGKALNDIKVEKQCQWIHLLDWFHKLQALKRMMIKSKVDKENRGDLLRVFSRLLKEPNPYIFKQLVEEMQCYGPSDRFILQVFLKDKDRYCVSQIPKKFFGFSVSSARSEAFNNIIKIYIPYSTFPSRFFAKVLCCEKNLILKVEKPVRFNSKLAHSSIMENIQDLQLKLQNRLYQQLVKSNSKTVFTTLVDLEVKEINKKCYVIDRAFNYCVEYFHNIDFWCCQCNYIFHTGIPCLHLLAVFRKYKISATPYVKKRWIKSGQSAKIENIETPTIQEDVSESRKIKMQINYKRYEDEWAILMKRLQKMKTNSISK